MISVAWKNDSIEVFLTNFIEIWMEILTTEIIMKRCKEMNPLLSDNALNYKDIVMNILSNIPEHIDKVSVEQIKLRTKIEGGSLRFSLNLSKGTCQDFWEIITKPLCVSSMEMIRQQKILVDLIKKKDEEIAEYRAEGVELIRRNTMTEPFREEQLKTVIPVFNLIECTNMFQKIENLYNKPELSENSETCIKPTSSKNIQMEKTEESITILSDSNTLEFKKDTQEKFGGIKLRKRSHKETKAIRLVPRSVKKLKPINEFIS
ncbi:PREDICTED: non-homologous end-joining factor 1-like [Dufourea novaeangliae]|uniref:non-homologous end-joining factor 1-like n=1 Tax=Dufourea novaeangliae TaxID=178035 RepID=UPI000766FC91|nr:PREDICTED: non-homologous end-joining factor 1-like [Dufourea novaeangliae]